MAEVPVGSVEVAAGFPLGPADPRRLGVYVVLRRLGEGGMGTVFLGRAPSGRLVAIKVIRAELARQEQFRARFRREAANARRVARFCTAEVLDADPDAELPYLVTEYVERATLARVVAAGAAGGGEPGAAGGGGGRSVDGDSQRRGGAPGPQAVERV